MCDGRHGSRPGVNLGNSILAQEAELNVKSAVMAPQGLKKRETAGVESRSTTASGSALEQRVVGEWVYLQSETAAL